MSTPLHKIVITPEEGKAALADLTACDRGFDLIHLQYEQYTASQKAAILLRRIDQLEKDLQSAQVKLNYGTYNY